MQVIACMSTPSENVVQVFDDGCVLEMAEQVRAEAALCADSPASTLSNEELALTLDAPDVGYGEIAEGEERVSVIHSHSGAIPEAEGFWRDFADDLLIGAPGEDIADAAGAAGDDGDLPG